MGSKAETSERRRTKGMPVMGFGTSPPFPFRTHEQRGQASLGELEAAALHQSASDIGGDLEPLAGFVFIANRLNQPVAVDR